MSDVLRRSAAPAISDDDGDNRFGDDMTWVMNGPRRSVTRPSCAAGLPASPRPGAETWQLAFGDTRMLALRTKKVELAVFCSYLSYRRRPGQRPPHPTEWRNARGERQPMSQGTSARAGSTPPSETQEAGRSPAPAANSPLSASSLVSVGETLALSRPGAPTRGQGSIPPALQLPGAHRA